MVAKTCNYTSCCGILWHASKAAMVMNSYMHKLAEKFGVSFTLNDCKYLLSIMRIVEPPDVPN